MPRRKLERVLVTGSTGFIGRHVCAYLRERGVAVRAYGGRLGSNHSARDAASLARGVRWSQGVVHLAGQPSVFRAAQDPIADAETNVAGTLQVLEQLRRCPRPLVFPSTVGVYPSRRTGVSLERDARPHTFYAGSKLAAESYVRLYSEHVGVPGVSLRLAYVYAGDVARGPFFDVCSAVASRSRILKLFTSPASSFDFVHVDDVAAAVEAALVRPVPAGAVVNIGTGRATKVADLVRLASAIAKQSQPKIAVAPASKLVRLVASNASARRLLGWKPRVSLESGIKEYLENYARKEANRRVRR